MSFDDLVSDLSSFTVSNDENCAPGSFRIGLYKTKTSKQDQDSRRAAILERQKSARHKKTALMRNITEDFEEGEEEGKRVNPFRNQLMLSEWMEHEPSDFAENWIFKLVPVGHRTLIVAQRGRTRSYTKGGYHTATFSSLLPGGNRYSKSGYTVLDGIWCEKKECFYILDIMCYKSHPVLDSETDFRFFWGSTKFREDLVGIEEVEEHNTYPLYWLPHADCTTETITKVISEDSRQFQLDGVLFYHKLCHYDAGATPLVGWLKPEMLNKVLSLELPDIDNS